MPIADMHPKKPNDANSVLTFDYYIETAIIKSNGSVTVAFVLYNNNLISALKALGNYYAGGVAVEVVAVEVESVFVGFHHVFVVEEF